MNIYRSICYAPIPNVIGGQAGWFQSSFGTIDYTVAGEGTPVLMVHGINAGASNFEWRANFRVFCKFFRVWALDLPGFGRSEKLAKSYRPSLYIKAITEFIEKQIGQPVYILSSGLSAAYCLAVANRNPTQVRGLALVTPSGITNNACPPNETSLTVFRLFTNPIQGDAIYNSFASPQSIEYFLKEFVYANPNLVTCRTVEYLTAAAHQCPYAEYAPASFVSGLSNFDIKPFYAKITQPMLILWGRQAKLNPIKNMEAFLQYNENATPYIFENSGLIPQCEEAKEFNRIVVSWFKEQAKE